MDTSSPVTPSQPTHTELKARLDELRVKLHLGGMEAHDKFQALSHDIAKFGRKAKRASSTAAHSLLDRIRELEAALAMRD